MARSKACDRVAQKRALADRLDALAATARSRIDASTRAMGDAVGVATEKAAAAHAAEVAALDARIARLGAAAALLRRRPPTYEERLSRRLECLFREAAKRAIVVKMRWGWRMVSTPNLREARVGIFHAEVDGAFFVGDVAGAALFAARMNGMDTNDVPPTWQIPAIFDAPHREGWTIEPRALRKAQPPEQASLFAGVSL